ncbi:MAG: hypothetical protein ABIS48_00065, partial [Candidatus Saccharimonadales bacterium]
MQYDSSEYDSSLESTTADVSTSQAAPLQVTSRAIGYNRRALIITGAAMLFAVIVGVGGLVLSSNKSKTQLDASGHVNVTNYSGGQISLGALSDGQQIEVGKADHLSINGQLDVANTVVITPTAQPTSPVAGQIYYDQTTSQPYY